MSNATFDLDGMSSASNQYNAAASQAATAQGLLAGAGLDIGALGGSASAQALGGAIQGFQTQQVQAAAGTQEALTAFAMRMAAARGIGDEGVAATSQAAGRY